MIVGGYRDALKFHPGEEITFNPDSKITKDIFMKKVTKTLTYG